MRIPQNDIQQLQQSMEAAKDILVLIHRKPTIDSLAAGLAFYLTLPKIGKRASIACPDRVTVEASHLVGIDKVTDTLQSKNFVISLDYVEGSIEKVSYNIEGDKFNLVIEPRPGFSFSADKVRYTNSNGSDVDLVIVVGTARLEDLATLHTQTADLLGRVDAVNIDTKTHNTRYARLNLIYPQLGSLSELVTFLLADLRLTIDSDTASNLLQGISDRTDKFNGANTTADSFEAAAILLRVGARIFSGRQKQIVDEPFVPADGYFPSLANRPPVRAQPMSKPVSQTAQTPPWQSIQSPVPSNDEEAPAPADWLKPKIFRSRKPALNSPTQITPSEGKGRTS